LSLFVHMQRSWPRNLVSKCLFPGHCDAASSRSNISIFSPLSSKMDASGEDRSMNSHVWKEMLIFVGQLMRSNPGGMLVSLQKMQQLSPKSLHVSALQHLVPIFRLWRLLLCDATANKGEKVPIVDLCRRLLVDEPATPAQLAGVVRSFSALGWSMQHISASSSTNCTQNANYVPVEGGSIERVCESPADYAFVLRSARVDARSAWECLSALRMMQFHF
jgi:hypothetical protein